MSRADNGSRTPSSRRLLRTALHGVIVAGALALLVTAFLLAPSGGPKKAPAQAATTAPSLQNVVEIHSAHGASYLPALKSKRPLFILALGSDARPGQDILRQRSDSIHLIGVNLKRHRATILGFPRDSWVPIPGSGTSKINTAMAIGGPDLTVRTIESLTGVRIDFWMLTSFNGLQNMVNEVGGLTVKVTQPMHDGYSGSNFNPGVHHLFGKQALSFARDRHTFTNGDLTRSANQGRLIVSALSKLHSSFSDVPAELLSWLSVGWRNFRTDLSLPTLLNLGLAATSIPPSSVTNLVVPATTGTAGGASVVFISSAAQRVYADMRADGVVG
jgi:LCP family protein required for cell wall assembly